MRRSTLLLGLAALAAAPARAQSLEHPFRDLVHARSMALGGAYRAFGLGVETVTGNPAAMSLYRKYTMELSGAWDITRRVAFASAGVMDGMSSLAAGVAYNVLTSGELDDRSVAHLNTLALSIPLMDNVFVGISAHYLNSSGALRANAVTGDAGLVVRVMEPLTIGVAGHNLVDTRHAALSTYFTAAAAFTLGTFSLVADARGEYRLNQAPLLGFNAGAEYILGAGIPLRAGWGHDESGVTSLSGGLGYMFEGGSVDAAYRHELNGLGRAVALTVTVSN